MRFGVPIVLKHRDLSNSPVSISINYDAPLLSLMKLGLYKTNLDLFKKLYEAPTQKLFATSVYFPGAKFTKDKIILGKENKLVLFFSTDDLNLGMSFYNAFIYLHHVSKTSTALTFGPDLTAEVWKLYLVNVPKITQNKVLFKTMSPIVLRDPNNKFLVCTNKDDMQKFNEVLVQNTIGKLTNHPELLAYAKELKFIPIHTKHTIRKEYNLAINATRGLFILQGNPVLLNFLQNAGLGSKTGSFAGMITAIW